MASAASLPIAYDRLFKEHMVRVPDPGDAGTIYVQNKGFAICEVISAGAETRVLPAAGGFGVGTTLTVVGKVLAGAVTITGANVSPILNTAGDVVVFILSTNDASDTKVWRVLSQSAGSSVVAANVVTEVTAASGADQIVTSAGASKVVKDSGIAITNVVTRAANAAGAGLIPQSGGADKSLAAVTPVALGTFSFNTGDATSDAKLVLLVNKLVALGLFTGTAS